MVSLEAIQSSNERIKSTLPPGLVAVFVGGTNGVGETTVRQFATHALRPRVYIIGRSQDAGDRIANECKTLNPEGVFVFLKHETSLMRNVDEICNELVAKEKVINLLFLSVGTLELGTDTEEGLHYPTALTIHARSRFISNLLPLLNRATGLRRVISVYCATFEGQIDKTDFQGRLQTRIANQAHLASVTTLSLEAHHKASPQVSFVHNFPGAVESGIARGSIGWFMRVLKTIWAILGPLVHIPLVEAGERHLFLCTSASFRAKAGDGNNGDRVGEEGVPVGDGLAVARGTNGTVGSGVYSIDAYGESAGPKVEKVLAKLREQGMVEWVHERIEAGIKAALAKVL